jgi:hypothetical protein
MIQTSEKDSLINVWLLMFYSSMCDVILTHETGDSQIRSAPVAFVILDDCSWQLYVNEQ